MAKSAMLGLGLLAALSVVSGCGGMVILDAPARTTVITRPQPAPVIVQAPTEVEVYQEVETYDTYDGYHRDGSSRGRGGYGSHTEVDVTVINRSSVVIAPVQPVVIAPARSESEGRNPVIQSFTANPVNAVTPQQPVTFTVVAHDPDDAPLQFNWAATGGTLSGDTGRVVVWQPPSEPGIYTVSTIITNARGGAVTGSQNLTVRVPATTPATLAAQ